MTKGTKLFRIIISVLLGLTILWSAFIGLGFIAYAKLMVLDDEYGFFVAGVAVTRENKEDILGDGTVSYSASNNILTFENAVIEYDYSVIYSSIDLMVQLIGENKFILSGDYVPAIYASDYLLSKDIYFTGDGDLTVEIQGPSSDAMGIYAEDLIIETDITIIMPNTTHISNGIYCDNSLTIRNGANVTVQNGSAQYSTAVKTRGSLHIEMDSALSVSVNAGTTDMCRGVNVGSSLVLWDDATLNVSVDDESATSSECIGVAGLLEVGCNATLSASAKKAYSIECFGSMKLKEGADVSASTAGEGKDVLCYGSIVNFGATFNAEIEALGGVHNKGEN